MINYKHTTWNLFFFLQWSVEGLPSSHPHIHTMTHIYLHLWVKWPRGKTKISIKRLSGSHHSWIFKNYPTTGQSNVPTNIPVSTLILKTPVISEIYIFIYSPKSWKELFCPALTLKIVLPTGGCFLVLHLWLL